MSDGQAVKTKRQLPFVRYCGVFRANLTPPRQPLDLIVDSGVHASLHPGPLTFSYSVATKIEQPPSAGITMGQRTVELPPGSYLLVEIDQRPLDSQEVRALGALHVAEIIGVIDLLYRGLVSDRIYEGVINTPGSFVWLPQGPLRLTAQPERQATEVAAMIADDLARASNLPQDRRERFRLAARWFRRGSDALNPVDKLLFWWTVLEIYPAEGKKKVPQITSELIATDVYPDLTPKAIKGKLKLGLIQGARSDVVHHGKAFITSEEERQFSGHLERLEAVAVVSLRLLLGLSPGDELDKYVRDDP